MAEHPDDFSWSKRLTRFAEMTGKTETKCWAQAGESGHYDIHSWLDEVEAELTAAQRKELKKL